MGIVVVQCRLFLGGALDMIISQITDEHKIVAAKVLAYFVKNPDCEHIIPSAFDEGVANAVAETVKSVQIPKSLNK